ncbi:ROK family protein [Tateyamaria omphalii]|uniref:ROK family transcriptional regulator n=1 Tax=Tateyamaria omphalii TaxID=299262 RepID=UPI001C9972FD|nr:ROK family transcriptional regulator [Tateyamaria omphalii]MBY5934989.1 ROK family protein [Tateyamaria omphalii]
MSRSDLLFDVRPGTNPDRSRVRNRKAVLGLINSAGQMGRAAVARSLGLSTQAVSNIIAELEVEGLLIERGAQSAGRGLPAVQYGVNPEGGVALGVEIRPDVLLTSLVDLSGKPRATRRQVLDDLSPSRVTVAVLKLRDWMLKECGFTNERLLGAGIVMPGPFGTTGLSGQASDLPGWQTVDVAGLFSQEIGRPVIVSNDANAAAMAERFSVAQGLTDYAFLYFGAGLGLGLVHRCQLVDGAFGNAGEIGHLPVMADAERKPLEQVVSRVSIQSALAANGPLDIEALDRLCKAKDPALMRWLETACDALGQAVGVIENLFDPQTVILGGAMPASILDHLANNTPLPELSVSNRPDAIHPRLQCGTSGRMTATFGAAALILNRAFTPQSTAMWERPPA